MAFQTPVVSSAGSVGEGDCLQDDHGVTEGNIHRDQDGGVRRLSPTQDAGILWAQSVCVNTQFVFLLLKSYAFIALPKACINSTIHKQTKELDPRNPFFGISTYRSTI